jgi:hypothetical protein
MNPTHDKVEWLEQDVDRIRNNIGALIGELNQRRHEVFDLKLQFRRHRRGFVLVAVAVVGSIAGGIAFVLSRWRHRHSLAGRALRMRHAARGWRRALGRMVAHPDRLLERGPSVSRKVAAAGGAAMASVLGKRLAKRLVSES